MLNGRFLCRAKRVDNGEVVKGYYCHKIVRSAYGKKECHSIFMPKGDGAVGGDLVDKIDPATIERVAVAVKNVEDISSTKMQLFCGNCPNCNRELSSRRGVAVCHRAVNYCDSCGQRLEWSEVDSE